MLTSAERIVVTTAKQVSSDGPSFRDLLLVGFLLRLAGRWGTKQRAANEPDSAAAKSSAIMDGYAQAVQTAAETHQYAMGSAHRLFDKRRDLNQFNRLVEQANRQYSQAIESAQEVAEALAPYGRSRKW